MAYFVVSEALSNVYKHADASLARIRISTTDGTLRITVADDGIGGADIRAGTGLRGLQDRVSAVAGHLDVSSPTGGGTTIVAELPCES